MLTPAQQEQRLDGITATDVSAILGQHPYRSRIDVWREKRGESAPFVENERSKWGELLEPVIRRDYEERHGCTVVVPPTLASPEYPWMLASPDGIVSGETTGERGLEIKCHTVRLAHLYGQPGTDEVPPHELCQCMWGMGVTKLPIWDLVPFIDGQPLEFTIARDEELIGIMREQAERFLVDNVRGGVQPEPDGSDAYDRYLKSKWATNTQAMINIGDDLETFDLIERGKALRDTINSSEDALEALVQTLKLKIEGNAGLRWKDAFGKELRITWKWGKGKTTIDYDGIVATMMHTAQLVLAAKRVDLAEMRNSLRAIGPSRVGNSKLSGFDMAGIVDALQTALKAVAENESEAEHTKITPVRTFRWPAAWNKSKADKEQ